MNVNPHPYFYPYHNHHHHHNNSQLLITNPTFYSNHYEYEHPKNALIKNLRLQIQDIHLSYINRDECTVKTCLQTKIENLIHEYLCLISHQEKFLFREFKNCLELTVKKSTFDPEKAIIAFKAIERYANNLLNYPWRHEYHRIFAFNGFFHRYIKCSLVGFENVFDLLGYKYDSTVDIFKLTEIPIDPDKMMNISLECFISAVELQIMKEIKSKCTEMTWKDIYTIRSEYVCNVQTSIEIFNNLKCQNKLIELDLPDYSVKKFNKLDLFSNDCVKYTDELYLLPPPSNYLDTDLDSIDFIDSPVKNEQITINDRSDYSSPDSNDDCDNNKQRIGSGKVTNLDSLLFSQIESFDNNTKNTRNVCDQNLLSNTPTCSSNMMKLEKNLPSTSIGAENKKYKTIKILSKTNQLDYNQQKSINEERKISQEEWSCASCTFVNDISVEICSMCHRSRTKGNESTPLLTGGKQCNKCTLVNDKPNQFCTACGTSLADSPTYI